MSPKIDIWEVRVTAPDGSHAIKLVTDAMVKLSVAHAGMNDYAIAAALTVYDFATMLTEADNADPAGKTDQLDGQRDSEVQANGQGQV